MDALRELVFDIGFKGNAAGLIKTNKAVDELKSRTEDASKKVEKLGQNISNTSKWSRGINKVKSAFDNMGKSIDKSTDKLSKKFKSVSTELSGISSKASKLGNSLMLKVTAPIAAAGGKMLKTASDFESGMSEVAAISGASVADLETLGAKARQLGKDTGLGAGKSAEALKYMAMAGWDTTQMLGGLEGVMNLASASGEDLGTVSDIVTDAMTAFGMSAEESTHFADVLATASSSANTNVAMMGETFKYVAPVAGALGFSVEDTALATGLMANAGIKAGQAGTALRGMFSKLVKPTGEAQSIMNQLGISLTDSQGRMKHFKDIMEDMRAGFSGLTEDQKTYYATTMFGQEAMSGALGIINASQEDFEKLGKAISSADGAAKKMAQTKLDNLKGDMSKLKSTFEETAVQLGNLLIPSIRKGVEYVKDFVEKFNNLDDSTKMTILKFIGAAAAMGPLAKGFSIVTDGASKLASVLGFLSKHNIFTLIGKGSKGSFGVIKEIFKFTKGGVLGVKGIFTSVKTLGAKGAALKGLGSALGGIKSGFLAINPAILPIIATIGALVSAGYILYKNWDAVKAKGEQFADSLQEKFSKFVPAVQGLWTNLQEIFVALLPVFGGVVGGILGGLGSILSTTIDVIGSVVEVFQGITDFLLGVFTHDWGRAWNGIKEIFKGVIDTITGIFGGVIDFFAKTIGGFLSGIGLGAETADKVRAEHSEKMDSAQVNQAAKAVDSIGRTPNSAMNAIKSQGKREKISAFATGITNFAGGLALVGEQGPELVHLPKGSSVYTADKTKSMLGQNSSDLSNSIYNESSSISREIYNSSSTSDTRKNAVYQFSPSIVINTAVENAEKTANLTKNKIREFFDEFVRDEELVF